MISISDLLTSQTTDAVEATFLDGLETLGVPARSWRAGGALRTILRVVAGVFSAFTVLALGFAESGFIETSSGGWLTLLAFYVYGVTRIPASYATGQVTLRNAGGGIYAYEARAFRVLSTVTGKAFTNVAAFTLGTGATLTIDVAAVDLGAASNAAPGDVTGLETTLPGVTATNSASIVGSDEEADADLRARCLGKLATISGLGPRGAYAYAVRSAVRSDGSSVDVNRYRILASPTTGVVSVIVASPSGAPLSSDLPFIAASIETYARPDSVTATVVAATPLPLTKTITVWARQTPGLAATDLSALVSASLSSLIASYPLGGLTKPPSTQGYLFGDSVAAAVINAHPSIYDVDGADDDVAMASTDVVTLATTIVVRLVAVVSS